MFAAGRARHHASTRLGSMLASWNPRSGIGRFPAGAQGNTGTPARASSPAATGNGAPSS